MMVTAESSPWQEQAAKVNQFVVLFGNEAYRSLAYHAALPLVLTPELVHYLRIQFLRDENVPWEAEVDLLLSDLCSQVGYELYAMDTQVRAYLLAQIKDDPVWQHRMQEVAQVLISYVSYLSRLNPKHRQKELEAQRLAAMTYLGDEQCQQAVQEIADRLKQLENQAGTTEASDRGIRAELAYLSRLTQELGPQLAGNEELVELAQLVQRLLRNPEAVNPNEVARSVRVGDYELSFKEFLPYYLREAVLPVHLYGTLKIAMSSNGRIIAVGDETGKILCWRLQGESLRFHQFTQMTEADGTCQGITNLAFGGDDVLAIAAGQVIYRWWLGDLDQPPELLMTVPSSVTSLTCRGDEYVAVGLQDGGIAVWHDLFEEPVILRRHTGRVQEVVADPEPYSDQLISRSSGNRMLVWNLREPESEPWEIRRERAIFFRMTWQQGLPVAATYVQDQLLLRMADGTTHNLPYSDDISMLRFSPNGLYLAILNQNMVRITNLSDLAQTTSLPQSGLLDDLAISNTGEFLLTLKQNKPNSPSTLQVWNVKLQQLIWEETAYSLTEFSLKPTPNTYPFRIAARERDGVIDGFPPFKTLTFETGQFVESTVVGSLPLLQSETVEVVTVEVNPVAPDSIIPSTELVTFSFDVATLEPDPARLNVWSVRKQQRQAQRYIERLGNSIFIAMVVIPGGSFVMGSPSDEPQRLNHEGPQHDVQVSDFWMGRYPVTQIQWRAVAAMPQQARELNPDPSHFKGDNRPVEQVNWYDAVEFCARLSAHTGRGYRLPTEAEWEYACRARTTTPFSFGDMITPEVANYNGGYAYNNGPKGENRGETTPVDHFKVANAFGLSDMHGNVYEWCQDHYHSSYESAPKDGSAWVDENAEENASRILRGGAWSINPRNCRSAFRNYDYPRESDFNFGFRVVCVAPRAL